MPSLSFAAPTSVDDAVKILAGATGMAKVLARILTASSTLVGAAKLRLGMFAPQIARAHLSGPREVSAPHSPLAYTTIPRGVKN